MSMVLVFEDNPLDADIIRAIAEKCGHQVKVYPDAPRFTEEMNFGPECRVVLDIRLFKSDAFDALGQLSLKKFRGEVILVSSESADYLALAEQYGKSHGVKIAGVLRKPIDTGRLAALLAG